MYEAGSWLMEMFSGFLGTSVQGPVGGEPQAAMAHVDHGCWGPCEPASVTGSNTLSPHHPPGQRSPCRGFPPGLVGQVSRVAELSHRTSWFRESQSFCLLP